MIRQIPVGERWIAADRAQAWGYPRPIAPREVETGYWFEDGRAICWFVTPLPDGPENMLAVHAIGDPEARRRVPIGDPRTMVAVEVIAELLGAHRLYSLIPREMVGGPMPIRAMRRYLRARGWAEDDLGCYKQLAEG